MILNEKNKVTLINVANSITLPVPAPVEMFKKRKGGNRASRAPSSTTGIEPGHSNSAGGISLAGGSRAGDSSDEQSGSEAVGVGQVILSKRRGLARARLGTAVGASTVPKAGNKSSDVVGNGINGLERKREPGSGEGSSTNHASGASAPLGPMQLTHYDDELAGSASKSKSGKKHRKKLSMKPSVMKVHSSGDGGDHVVYGGPEDLNEAGGGDYSSAALAQLREQTFKAGTAGRAAIMAATSNANNEGEDDVQDMDWTESTEAGGSRSGGSKLHGLPPGSTAEVIGASESSSRILLGGPGDSEGGAGDGNGVDDNEDGVDGLTAEQKALFARVKAQRAAARGTLRGVDPDDAIMETPAPFGSSGDRKIDVMYMDRAAAVAAEKKEAVRTAAEASELAARAGGLHGVDEDEADWELMRISAGTHGSQHSKGLVARLAPEHSLAAVVERRNRDVLTLGRIEGFRGSVSTEIVAAMSEALQAAVELKESSELSLKQSESRYQEAEDRAAEVEKALGRAKAEQEFFQTTSEWMARLTSGLELVSPVVSSALEATARGDKSHQDAVETAWAKMDDDLRALDQLKTLFAGWKSEHRRRYKAALVSLALPGVFAPYVATEVMNWTPWSGSGVAGMSWFTSLFDFGMEGEQGNEDDPDSDLVPKLVVSVVGPASALMIEHGLDVTDASAVDSCIEAVSEIKEIVEGEGESGSKLTGSLQEAVRAAYGRVGLKGGPTVSKWASAFPPQVVSLIQSAVFSGKPLE